ncbi:MAG: Ig-like domain-containing protein [Acidobacteriota bacterium]
MTSASGPQGGGSAAADSSKPIYLDTTYSFEERAADLVSRMTLEEKQSQLGNTMPAVPRLGVNAYNVWGEALHGVVTFFDPSGSGATSFPNSVAVGASWDPAKSRITFDPGRYVFEIGSSSKDIRGTAEAVMSGSYSPRLKTVVAEADEILLAPGATISSRVTAAMSDDRFADPSRMQVTFSSNRPAVAAVDQAGRVTAHAPGVATITARVTVEGKTLSDGYALKVMPNLSLAGLSVNGTDLGALEDENHGVSFLLAAEASAAPRVEASPSGPSQRVETAQAGSLPGTALITVTDPATGEQTRYGIDFGFEAKSDQFNEGSIGSQWKWLRGDPASRSLEKTPGSLILTAQDGDLKNRSNDGKNVLLQPAVSDWFIESKLAFSRAPSALDQQGGLVAYQDDDNYVKLVYDRTSRGFMGTANRFELIVEQNGAEYPAATLEAGDLMLCNRTVVFRLEKKGSRYTAYYSKDGNEFTPLGTADVVLANVQVGLIAFNGSPAARNVDMMAALFGGAERQKEAPFEVGCDYFDIRSRGQKLP